MPTTLVGRPTVALFNTSGLAPDGIVYVDGVRGTLTLTSGGLGTLPVNTVKVDFVPSKGTISVGVALVAAIDSQFNPFNPTSGSKWGLEYILPTASAGQFGIIIRDGWVVT